MYKFSVKKPLTVFVAVIAVLVLGVVAYTRMVPDLLPNMDFPYVMIMTTYPGASPEKVEAEITKPMEQTMATLEHIREVTSTSSENASMVLLEFEESVNMDTIGVDIQQKIAALSAGWGDMVGVPYVLKINPSMLPIQVAALSMKDMTSLELTEFLNDTLMNKLEGIPGVARISTTGMIEQALHVVLDQELIDQMNRKIADSINGKLDDAAKELSEKKEELENSKEDLASAQSQLNAGADAIIQGQNQLTAEKAKLEAALAELEEAIPTLEVAVQTLNVLNDQLQYVLAQRNAAYEQLSALENLVAQGEQIKGLELEILTVKEQIAALESSGENPAALENLNVQLTQLEAELAMNQATYAAGLAAWGATGETLPSLIQRAKSNCQIADTALDAVDQLLASQNTDREGLASLTAELNAQLAQAVAARDQLEAGLMTMEEAEAMLEQQKLSGLIQLSTAAAQIAAGSANIDMALVQIESGMTTLEDSRADALRQADLNNIITMELVTQILTAQNFAMPAGYVEEDGVSYMVSVGDEIRELETLQNLLLFDMGMEGVDPIYLKDIAVVALTDNRDETYARLNSQSAVMLSFEKQSTYATAEVSNNISQRFRELEKTYPGLEFVSLMSQGDYIYLVVNSILNNLFLGALFSVLVLLLFLKDLRPTFITLCSIPISVIFAIVLMYFSGVTLNMISLSGLSIAVGMLVDNSIVVIENIYRLRAKGANVIQAAVSGAGQMVGAVTASTLTTICVFVPIVFVEGITRQLFTDLALTMTYALLASLVIALTLVPAMATGMLRKDYVSKPGFMDRFFLPAYRKAITWSLKYKALVLILSAGALAFSAWASLSQGFTFMPAMDSPNITVSVSMPEGIDMEEASNLADDVQERIAQVDGIDTVGAMMSAGTSSVAGISVTSFDVTVYVTLESEDLSGAEIARQIESVCEGMPCTVSATSAMMDTSMLTGSGISIRIYADDMGTLQSAAKQSAAVLSQLEGIESVSDGLEEAAPALHVAIDRNEAMRHGLTVAQIYLELASGLTTGGTVASLNLDGITTDVIIEKPEGAVLNAQELRDYVFEVTGTDGEVTEVPLKEFAAVEETSSLSSISRLNQRRYLTVTAMLQPGQNVTLMTAKAQSALRDTDLGNGVSYTFSGENETIMEAMEQLVLMLLLGMLLVYLIMVAQFQSLLSPFIVMFTIPLAFTGGFLGLLLCRMEVSVISMIGFVMLVGIIVNNGIVLVDYINQLRMEGAERRAAIIEAGVTRMRPILMTTLTTILGQLVMAVSQDVGSTLMRPISVVSIGGLTYATIMTLFVVPCIYDLLCRKELRVVREEDLKLVDF